MTEPETKVEVEESKSGRGPQIAGIGSLEAASSGAAVDRLLGLSSSLRCDTVPYCSNTIKAASIFLGRRDTPDSTVRPQPQPVRMGK